MKNSKFLLSTLLIISGISATAMADENDGNRMPVRPSRSGVTTEVITYGDDSRIVTKAEKPAPAPKQQKQEQKAAKPAKPTHVAKAKTDAKSNVPLAMQLNSKRPQTQEEIDAKINQYLGEAREKSPKYEHKVYYADWETEPFMAKTDLMKSLDAISRTDGTLYRPKNVSNDVRNNEVYLHFDVSNSVARNLCFHSDYYADDMLDIQKVELVVNGRRFYFSPKKVNAGRDGRFYWERFDDPFSADNRDLVDVLARAYTVRLRYIGKSCSHVKRLNDAQVKNIKSAAQLFLTLGGKLN